MFLALFCALSCHAATVRSKADLRLWETAQDRSLAWPWAPGADTAALAFSNRVTRSVASVAVLRGEGETRGGCELPADSPLENIQAMVKAAEDFAAKQ